jgi:cobalamin biosynthesis protein CobT
MDVEKDLLKVLPASAKKKRKEDEQAYLKRLAIEATRLEADDWEALDTSSQEWVDAAVLALNKKKPLPGFSEAASDDEEEEDDEQEEDSDEEEEDDEQEEEEEDDEQEEEDDEQEEEDDEDEDDESEEDEDDEDEDEEEEEPKPRKVVSKKKVVNKSKTKTKGDAKVATKSKTTTSKAKSKKPVKAAPKSKPVAKKSSGPSRMEIVYMVMVKDPEQSFDEVSKACAKEGQKDITKSLYATVSYAVRSTLKALKAVKKK